MSVRFLLDRFSEAPEKTAIIGSREPVSFGALKRRIEEMGKLEPGLPPPGAVCLARGPASASFIATLLFLAQRECIAVPLSDSLSLEAEGYAEPALGEWVAHADTSGKVRFVLHSDRKEHELLDALRRSGRAGLILFTSGSSGQPKAVLHDLKRFLAKFRRRRHDFKTLLFLPLDHVGGLDTLFYALSNSSTLVIPEDRSPASVCRAVEDYQVEVLPVTPSFLNLLALSGVYHDYDLTSLKYVTYGAEVMPEETLRRCQSIFPQARLLQKYGTTEFGSPRSYSESSGSLWMRLEGDDFQTRVVNGLLEVKAESSMLGYLNAADPFTEDGWLQTGDRVEVKGGYYRILGRDSDLISVGGEKVDPSEIESVLTQDPEVLDCIVYGISNILLGQVPGTRIQIAPGTEIESLEDRLTRRCREQLERFKRPAKYEFTEEFLSSGSLKRQRPNLAP